jgi:spore maturation protein CgeB
MRVMVVRPGPHFSVADVARGWVKGLRAIGCTVLDFNFDDRLNFYSAAHVPQNGHLVRAFDPREAAMLAAKGVESAAYEFLPDVVVIVSGFFIPPAVYELIRLRGSKVVLVHTESPYEDDRQVPRSAFADLNVLNDPTNIDRFPANTIYLPHAYDPDIHYWKPAMPGAASDFCFVGTGYTSRQDFFEQVDFAGVDVALAGNWRTLPEDSPLRKYVAHNIDECCPNEVTADLYASTKVSANLYRKEASESADGWSMGPREVELAAMGTFFLRESRPEGDALLTSLPIFDSPEDFTEKLRWWLSHDAERLAAADAARLAVADRTFDKHAAQMLTRLGV